MAVYVDLEKVWDFAVFAHEGQKDKEGQPYWTHLAQVWQNTIDLGGDVPTQAAAILHDVVEDTAFTLKDMEGFVPEKTVKIIEAMTKRPSEHNPTYIGRVIAGGRGSRIVKLADLRHNTDPERLAQLPENTVKRLLNKYYEGIYRIEGALKIKRTITKAQVEEAKAAYNASLPKYTHSTYYGASGGKPYTPGKPSAYKDTPNFGPKGTLGASYHPQAYDKTCRAFALIRGDVVKSVGSVKNGKVERIATEGGRTFIFFEGRETQPVVVARDLNVTLVKTAFGN